jgi:hypothetical protein
MTPLSPSKISPYLYHNKVPSNKYPFHCCCNRSSGLVENPVWFAFWRTKTQPSLAEVHNFLKTPVERPLDPSSYRSVTPVVKQSQEERAEPG